MKFTAEMGLRMQLRYPDASQIVPSWIFSKWMEYFRYLTVGERKHVVKPTESGYTHWMLQTCIVTKECFNGKQGYEKHANWLTEYAHFEDWIRNDVLMYSEVADKFLKLEDFLWKHPTEEDKVYAEKNLNTIKNFFKDIKEFRYPVVDHFTVKMTIKSDSNAFFNEVNISVFKENSLDLEG